MKKLSLVLVVIIAAFTACKNGGKLVSKEFKKLPSGLEYKFIEDKDGKDIAKEGSVITMFIRTMIGDSVLFDAAKMNKGEPVPATITPKAFNGDVMEGLAMMSPGDSAVFLVPADSLFRGGQKPPFVKDGDKVQFTVRMVTVKSAEQDKKDKDEASSKRMKEQEGVIQKYLKDNNITAQKTPDGIYYVITQPGTGPNAAAGKSVKMKYTGKLLDGTVFDSNIDPKFQHTEPLELVIGQGAVIKGWDLGLQQFNKGSKGKLILASDLAYGEREMPGGPNNPKGIPANSMMVFDVEMLDISDPKPAEQPQMQMQQPTK
jgi:FKBP-type peptidyl-prolyl cis-trans isomerase FkpA